MADVEFAESDQLISVNHQWLRPQYFWLAVGLGTAILVYVAYLLTHPYPAYAGGLFLVMAEQVSAHGYQLPTTIPHYTKSGIPFGYPPLMFYATALLHDLTGAPLVAISRYVPGLIVIAYLVPYYAIARDLLNSPRRAGIATVLFAATPTVLRWHLSAGGLVRAPAMLFALAGVYTGLRVFKYGDMRWLMPGVVLFGLTILNHPTYSVFFAMSYVLLFIFFDQSARGLLAGTIVATAGLTLAAPWWLSVASKHGVDIFFTASGTHGGLAGGPSRLIKLGQGLDEMNIESGFYVTAFAGGIYALFQRRYFLPTWTVTAGYFIGKNRFTFVAGSMLTVILVFDYILPMLHHRITRLQRQQLINAATVAMVIGATTLGGLYAASALAVAHDHSPSQPQAMDTYDKAAMNWAKASTEPDETFAVLGDPGEWFPLIANRTIVLGPWGWEWKRTQGYYQEMKLYDTISTCPTETCLNFWLEESQRNPDYIYIPKGTYTVRGRQFHRGPGLRRSMIHSDRYKLAYENPDVAVFRVNETLSREDRLELTKRSQFPP